MSIFSWLNSEFYTPAADRADSRQAPASQMRKLPNWESPKGDFPKPKNGGIVAQFWNLPNLEGVYNLPSMTINASTAEVEYECMKVPEEAPKPCNANINN
ncbi:hypothetical protein DSO57_1027430 [Entomophthora muscae]|uniref:Uncharacterized protein n=1 Tax=Entomophthora muscae TaxID=34485 RepID=A0ACC2UBI9_9FUNG|nr:hypothetical protein DSO57_1027430 [Entomophthora muscae]